MRLSIIIFIITPLLFACNQQSNQKIINVSEFGILPDTKQNSTALVNELIKELKDEPVIITFPKGKYHFYPDSNYLKPYFETNTYDVNPKRLAVYIENKRNITIDGQGSDFIYHDHIQPFTVDHSENITIKNINIDWENPLTAESEIIESDSSHVIIKIDTAEFPYSVHEKGLTFAADNWKAEWKLTGGSWLIVFDTNHIIPANTGDHGTIAGDLDNVQYSEISPGLVLIKGKFTKIPPVGNFWVMRHSTRDHAGIFLFHSKNLKLQNANVYHTSGLGILSQYCENIEMQNVNMIPNPKKNRYLSGHDDGLHFMGCKGEIIVDNCDSQGLMDDPVNIHGTYVPVVERLNKFTLNCSYAHGMSLGLIWAKQGDTIGFVEKKTMNTIGVGIISKFHQLDEKHIQLEFNDSIPNSISKGYSLENLSCTPNVTITNCYVGSNRARGFLISTPGKVLIENNVFETSGSAILIAGDANYWYESGPVTDITIRNNEFRAPCNSSPYQFCKAVISVFPEIPEADSLHPYHKNITIENNTFSLSDYPLLYAKSVEGLIFKNNIITRSYSFEPWHYNKIGFVLNACTNIEIANNHIDNDVLGRNIVLKRMSTTELKLKNAKLHLEN